MNSFKLFELKFEHAVMLKFGIGMGILAAVFVPPPWSHLVGIGANMVWLWKF